LNKVALISDIQGNLTALQYVLRAIDNDNIKQIICLGDVASGAFPHAVVSLLQERNIAVVKGNMDDAILNPQRHDSDDPVVARYDDMDQWCSEQLTDDNKTFMRGFKPLIRIALDSDHELLCVHGSPYSYNDVIDETTPEETLAKCLDGYDDYLMATGHVHHPFMRIFQDTKILCPGSVGLPRQRNSKHPAYAEYVTIAMQDGQEQIEFRQVKIPSAEFKKGILTSGMPHANWFLSLWDV